MSALAHFADFKSDPLHTVRTWSQKADCRPHKASFQDLGLRDLCRRGALRKVTPRNFAVGFAQDFFVLEV